MHAKNYRKELSSKILETQSVQQLLISPRSWKQTSPREKDTKKESSYLPIQVTPMAMEEIALGCKLTIRTQPSLYLENSKQRGALKKTTQHVNNYKEDTTSSTIWELPKRGKNLP